MRQTISFILSGLICLATAVPGLAWSRTQAIQPQSLYLQAEKGISQKRIEYMQRQIALLKERIAQAQHAAATKLKPYYQNLETQQICEQWQNCSEKMRDIWKASPELLISQAKVENVKKDIFGMIHQRLTVTYYLAGQVHQRRFARSEKVRKDGSVWWLY